jgi:hypothetical protein
MDTKTKKNGSDSKIPKHLNALQRRRWKRSYDLLRTRTDTPDQEARDFALKEVQLLDEIDHELQLVES